LQSYTRLTTSDSVARISLKAALFESIDDPSALRLLGGRCRECERFHFPQQEDCPYCGATECESARLSRSGTVYLCTTVTARPPGYDGPIPYGFGVVQLPEGLRIITRIVDPQTVSSGATVALTLESVGTDEQGNDIVTYAFRCPATSDE
jgi:uncharacterized OB-fold protein